MKQFNLRVIVCLIILQCIVSSCSKDDPNPVTGKVSGTVTDGTTGAALAGVRIIVFNADDNAPTGNTLTTDNHGNFSADLAPGNYFLKFYKQGYDAVPPPVVDPVPFTIETGATTEQSAAMYPTTLTTAGLISGKVTASSGVAGILVVAEDNANNRAYSTVSAHDGSYSIYNVPAGNYTVKGYAAGYASAAPSASVTAGAETANITIALTNSTAGKLTGSVRNLASGNKDVDVSLVHPITKETIPGLTTHTSGLTYTIDHIPNGTYIARATYKNDQRVMDPDRIAKFGEPVVTFNANNTIQLTFDITGSVSIVSPTNDAATNKPVEVNSATPTFTWTAYSSTSDYVIEVTDASTGVVVWGGFNRSGALPAKSIIIPASQRSIQYNADGSASVPQLLPGKVYRWRVFASKNDQNSTTGWTLISASEDQQGLFKVIL